MRRSLPSLVPGLIVATGFFTAASAVWYAAVNPSVGVSFDAHRRVPASIARGFYAAESTPQGVNFAWTNGEGHIVFPDVDRRTGWLVRLRLARGSWPAGAEPPTVSVDIDGRVEQTVRPSASFTDVDFTTQRRWGRRGMELGLRSPTFIPGHGDSRRLGIVVASVSIEPDGYVFPSIGALAATASSAAALAITCAVWCELGPVAIGTLFSLLGLVHGWALSVGSPEYARYGIGPRKLAVITGGLAYAACASMVWLRPRRSDRRAPSAVPSRPPETPSQADHGCESLLGKMSLRVVLLVILSLIYCRGFIAPFVLEMVRHAGGGELLLTGHDWDYFYFLQTVVHRSLLSEHQWPFWNPWYRGGMSLWSNPQLQFPTPLWVLNFAAGPIQGTRLQVVIHHWIGLFGMWWLARRLGMSRRAALLTSCGFMMSTWYSLHLAEGHAGFWPVAFMPWAFGCLYLARQDFRWTLGAAAWQALVIFEGGTNVYLIFLVMAACLVVAWTVEMRSWRPIVAFASMAGFSVAFAAVRVLPEAALLAQYPRQTEAGSSTLTTSGSGALVAQLARAFLGRGQHVTEVHAYYAAYGWHEQGAYIGLFVLLLFVLAPFLLRRDVSSAWPWYFAALACLFISIGNFGSFSPWLILHKLPIYSQSRVPSRYLIPCVLCIAVVAGLSYDALSERLPRRFWLALDLLLILGCVDLAMAGGDGFHNEAEFRRILVPPPAQTVQTLTGSDQAQTALMTAGYRTTNRPERRPVEPLPVLSHAAAVGEADYRGELYVEVDSLARSDSWQLVRLLEQHWTPGRMTLLALDGVQGRVVWNMNWAPGWRSSPNGAIESRNGLLALQLAPSHVPVTLYYVPEKFELGLTVTLMALAAALGWLWLARRHGSINGAPSTASAN